MPNHRSLPGGLPQVLSPQQPPGLGQIGRRTMNLECDSGPALVVANEPEGDSGTLAVAVSLRVGDRIDPPARSNNRAYEG